MDPDTIMYESSRMPSNSAVDLRCALTRDSARGFNSSLFTHSPFTPRYLPTHRSHQLSRDRMLLCDWAALHSVAKQLAVR